MSDPAPRHPPPRPHRRARRGGLYIAVLGASILITVLGLAALTTARIEGRSAVAEADIAEARRCAAAALELGRYIISSDSTWRTHGNGDWVLNSKFGKGTLTVNVSDPSDGDITNLPYGPVLVTGIGGKGDATQKLSVTLTPQTLGWECLNSGLHAGGAVTFTSATLVADRTCGSNAAMTAAASSIQTNVEAVGAIAGATYTKSTTTGIPARSMPDSNVFNPYIAAGAALDRNLLASTGGKKYIENLVLSPGSNPIGPATSAAGIYVLDCNDEDIVIRNCRIVGTLILLNPGLGTTVTGSLRWDPATSNYPALLVRGPITIATSQTPLSEATQNTNFNPAGTPYGGSSDIDKTDTYPSSIAGLVYTSGNAAFQGYNTISGIAIIGGTLSLTANAATGVAARLDLTYNGAYYTSPPPGFAAPTRMVVSPGTFTQVVN